MLENPLRCRSGLHGTIELAVGTRHPASAWSEANDHLPSPLSPVPMASNVAAPKSLPSITTGSQSARPGTTAARARSAAPGRHNQLGNSDGVPPLGRHEPFAASERTASCERSRLLMPSNPTPTTIRVPILHDSVVSTGRPDGWKRSGSEGRVGPVERRRRGLPRLSRFGAGVDQVVAVWSRAGCAVRG